MTTIKNLKTGEVITRDFTENQLAECKRDGFTVVSRPHMNSIELKNKLVEMAQRIPAAWQEYKDSIINLIMAHYMTAAGYYEEDAIATMQGFIARQIIDWKYKKVMSI